MVALRQHWAERRDWWGRRSGRTGEIFEADGGARALTWRAARRICEARSDFPPEVMIEDDWFSDWIRLFPGEPGYISFLAFIETRIAESSVKDLWTGLDAEETKENPTEFGDDWYWCRRVAEASELIGYGFHIITPFDERPGQIRHGPKEEDDGCRRSN
jgi:hypothetical protein